MQELPKKQYDYWEKETTERLTHDSDGVQAPVCRALRDAIFTLRMRDKEIEELKSKK
jgi:hypothetical protein